MQTSINTAIYALSEVLNNEPDLEYGIKKNLLKAFATRMIEREKDHAINRVVFRLDNQLLKIHRQIEEL
jgi:hypothetical protein